MTKPTTVDEYLAARTGVVAERLVELRHISRDAAPDAAETIKWGHPAVVHKQGTILFVYSAHNHHVNFTFTPSTREAFTDELIGFDTGKGSVKLPYGDAVPEDLLKRMIAYRIRECEDDGVTWM